MTLVDVNFCQRYGVTLYTAGDDTVWHLRNCQETFDSDFFCRVTWPSTTGMAGRVDTLTGLCECLFIFAVADSVMRNGQLSKSRH